MSYLREALSLVAALLLTFYAICLALRFLAQWARGLSHNPISVALFVLTEPVLRPLRRLLPSWRSLDLPCLTLLALVKIVQPALLTWLGGGATPGVGLLVMRLPAGLLELFINVFLFCILLLVLLSWVNPDTRHPGAHFIRVLAELLLRPTRRFTPRLPGIDLSPLLAGALLLLAKVLIVAPLYDLTGGRPLF